MRRATQQSGLSERPRSSRSSRSLHSAPRQALRRAKPLPQVQRVSGEPKGVPIHHSNVRSYIEYICDRYEVNERDRFSQEFDMTFDLSVHDMFVCWERGACLFSVPEKSVMLPAKFTRDHELTMWFSVPSVVALLSKMRLLLPGCFRACDSACSAANHSRPPRGNTQHDSSV